MEELIKAIKEFVEQDLEDSKNPLVGFFGSPESKVVQDIVVASKGISSED